MDCLQSVPASKNQCTFLEGTSFWLVGSSFFILKYKPMARHWVPQLTRQRLPPHYNVWPVDNDVVVLVAHLRGARHVVTLPKAVTHTPAPPSFGLSWSAQWELCSKPNQKKW